MKQKIVLEKIIVELSRVIVGATFAFSGFVKAVDPLGFTYKMQDYLISLNLEGLFSIALPLAIIMVVAEFVLGVFLLLGINSKVTTRLIGLFMVFFTPLTFWIALTNPVADCGCFGDALVISNWVSFYKNIILFAGIAFLVIKWKKITPLFSAKKAIIASFFIILYGLLFSLHNTYNLPIIDFRPYKIGANIPDQMFVDPDKADIYETIFIYSKDGVEKEFSESDYPWNDSSWIFIDMETRLVKEGIKPAIEDFAIESLYLDESGEWSVGGDITDLILSDTTYTFIMVSYSLEKMSERYLPRFNDIVNYADEKGYPFYLLTASSTNSVKEWEAKHNTGVQFCHADERTLKTMIRANPGLMLIKEGTVINKWDDSKVPSPENLLIKKPDQGKGTELLISIILFFVPLLILKVSYRKK